MRILVIGAGAIGGYFGARLLAAGRDVTFLVRAARAEQLRRSGLVLVSQLQNLNLPAPPLTTAGAIEGTYDLIIVSSKSYDLEAAIADFAPALGKQSRVLPLLNGLRHLDLLDAHFGAHRVLGGLARISATLDGEGRIHHLGPFNSLSFGARPTPPIDIAPVTAALQGAGFDAALSDDIEHDMWEKWVFIAAAAAATSLMRATAGDIAAANAEQVPLQLLQECSAIAAANGFTPRAESLRIGLAVLTAKGSDFSASMLRDIENGSRIEAEHIIGDLLRRATAATYAPLLTTAFAHVRAYEARRARETNRLSRSGSRACGG